jgi:hypothetical protein
LVSNNANPQVGVTGVMTNPPVRPTLYLAGDMNVGTRPIPTAGSPPVGQYQSELDVTNARVQISGNVNIGAAGPDVATDGRLRLYNSRLDIAGTMNVVRGYVYLHGNSSTIAGNVSMSGYSRLTAPDGTAVLDGNVSLLDAFFDQELKLGAITVTGDLCIDNTYTPAPDSVNSGLLLWANAAGNTSKVTVGGDPAVGIGRVPTFISPARYSVGRACGFVITPVTPTCGFALLSSKPA